MKKYILFVFMLIGAVESLIAQTANTSPLQFNGSNQYGSVPNVSGLEFAQGTVEVWVKPTWDANTQVGNPAVIAQRDPTGTRYSFHINNALSGVGLWNSNSYNTRPYTFVKGTWYHLAFVMTSTNTEIFVNGTSIGFTGNAINTAKTGLPLNIGVAEFGASSYFEIFKGELDDIRIWNTPRTAAQISASYQNPVAANSANLIAYYQIESGITGSSNQQSRTLTDVTANKFNGKLYNYWAPVVSSATPSTIKSTSAILGGNVSSEEDMVSDYGIVYSSTNTSPTISNTKVKMGNGDGMYATTVYGLSANTTYYARAYATNTVGTTYGDVNTFRTLNTNAFLSGLSISNGTLTPTFNSNSTSYSATVDYSVSSLTVTPTLNDPNAKVKVAGVAVSDQTASQSINLGIGTNSIGVVVTAEDGLTNKTYTVNVTRNKKSQEITFDRISEKTYGDVDFDAGATSSSNLSIAYSSDNTAVATIVNGKVHIVSAGTATITAGQAGDDTYAAANNVQQILTVRKKALTVSADNKSKAYGDINPELTVAYDGLVNNETALKPAPTVSTTATELSGVGTYDIEATGSSDNYELTFKKGTLTIGKKALTVTAENKSKTYGDENPELTVKYDGLVNNETALSPAPTVTTAATKESGAGTYDIEATGSSDNYELTFKKGTLTIGKKALTITAEDKSKTYGDENPELTVKYDGLVNRETTLSPAPTVTTAATKESGAGTYDIEATGSSDNYELTFKKGTLTIGKKALTVTAEDNSKTYGGENPTLTVKYDGLVNNEIALSPSPTVTTTATKLSGVGTYDIEATGTSDNYELTFKKGTLTIGKKALTVTAEDKSKVYGEINPALTVKYDGLVNNETALSPAPTVTTTATELSGVGTYDIEATGTSDNYELTFKKGTLTIGKKALTVTAEDKSKVYGEINPALTVKYDGLVNNETALSPAPTVTTAATKESGAGTYDIEATGSSDNYELTFKKGTLTIGKKALTVIAEDKSKTYGDENPELTVKYDGLVNRETTLSPTPTVTTAATKESGAGTYDIEATGSSDNYELTFKKGTLTIGKKALTVTAEDKSKTYGDENSELTVKYDGLVNRETTLSPAPTVTTAATKESGAGTYDIEATGSSDNYELTFKKGTLTIGKKALTVTAEDKSKTYGDENPELTVKYDGLVNRETTLSPAPTVTTAATKESGAGIYDIEATGSSDNYELTFKKGTLTIGKKALTVTAEDKSKTYGDE
uniref:MBG domain-containing protein n=1 Tax=Desertivirga brevis TaxID=2810310 RepID=UPI001A95BCA1